MLISYPAMVYQLESGSYMVDIPNLGVLVEGETFLEVSEKADEVATGIILFRNLRQLDLPDVSIETRPRKDIDFESCFKIEVCVAEKHYVTELEK